MAKVTKSKSGKAQGVTPEQKKGNSNEIIAVKNGKQRKFSRLLWDHLPLGKEGWEEVAESPKEPETNSDKKEDPESKSKQDSKKDSDKKEDENDSENKKTLTQEDLDLNPDLALKGHKVGDIIELEEKND